MGVKLVEGFMHCKPVGLQLLSEPGLGAGKLEKPLVWRDNCTSKRYVQKLKFSQSMYRDPGWTAWV